tara:strand:- start:49 stop:630 length:582 start_codon:yes stop_codon:yes gene_type:complete
MDIKPKTVILLIDFKGHPILASDYVNSLRYSTLQQITENQSIDKENCIILSIGNSNTDQKLQEIKKIALINKFKWANVENDNITVDQLSSMLESIYNFNLNNKDTQIILGGCNTSGCVLKTKNISVKDFGLQKFETYIILPMCAEYEASGINDVEKNMKSFYRVFNFIKKHKLETIHLLDNILDIYIRQGVSK